MELTDAQTACLAAIVDADQAWSLWGDLESRHGADVLAELVLLELVVPWERPDYLAVTLTPYGAWLLSVVIEEPHWEFVETLEPQWQGPDRPEKLVRVKRGEAIPEWVRCEAVDPETLDPIRPLVGVKLGGTLRQREQPVVLPRFGGECPLVLPEQIPAPEPEPEPAGQVDLEDGSGRDWSRIRLFAGRDGEGVPVDVRKPPRPR